MAKIIKKSNYRVIVEPDVHPGWLRRKSEEEIAKEEKSSCEEIMEQIKRHVDNVGRMRIEHDVEESCSHCHLDWDVAEDGTPNCCQQAIDEFETTKAKA